jgi:hypothetical protein
MNESTIREQFLKDPATHKEEESVCVCLCACMRTRVCLSKIRPYTAFLILQPRMVSFMSQ